MSALRQLLAWLGAAIWLRSRLLAIKARRLFGGRRPVAGAGTGYYLAAADIPVEGVDYELVDLPSEQQAQLDAARVELIDHARAATNRRSRRRRARRRRTASLVTAALVSLTVLGAGATALVTGSTGVPAVDRLLGIYETKRDRSDGVPHGDLRPTSAGPVIEFEARNGDRTVQVSSVTYAGTEGRICMSAVQMAPSSDPEPLQQGDASCEPAATIDRDLARDGLTVVAIQVDDVALITGLTRASTRSLTGTGPHGPLQIRIGDVWQPPDGDGAPVRPFVAVGTVGRNHDASQIPRALNLSEYRFGVGAGAER